MLTVVKEVPTLLEALDPDAVARVIARMRVTELSIGKARFRFHDFESIRMVSDSCEYHGLDAVFPLHPESLLLSLLIPCAKEGAEFLDVGCGSGILPIVAARRGWRSNAIDINPRALEFAACSAELSECSVNLEGGDIRTYDPGRRFDFITLNLPFEPTAGITRNFTHSDGGRYGHELNTNAARRLANLLCEGGTAVMMAFSLQQDGISTLECLLAACEIPLASTLIRLSDQIPVGRLAPRYGLSHGERVVRKLRSAGYSSFFIELAVFRKRGVENSFDLLHSRIADESWIYPLGEHALTPVASPATRGSHG